MRRAFDVGEEICFAFDSGGPVGHISFSVMNV